MIKNSQKSLIFFYICIFLLPIQAKRITSQTINPTVSEFDSTFDRLSFSRPSFLQQVTDQSPTRDSIGTVGETRIRRKTMIPVICKPSPATCVLESFRKMLLHKKCASDSIENADVIIDVNILDFNLKESYNKITQTMDAKITLMVVIHLPDASTLKFSTTVQNSYTTLDTSKHAERILRQALKDALLEILKNMAELKK